MQHGMLDDKSDSPIHGASITLHPKWLIVSFAQPQLFLSWAIAGGGIRLAQQVCWHQVHDRELHPACDPADLLRNRMREEGLGDAVGLMTSRDLSSWESATHRHKNTMAWSVATVGMGNAISVGDLPSHRHVGTINVLCWCSAALSFEARLEALAIMAEARTAAVMEAELPSQTSGQPCTGTGTDCLVFACPVGVTEAVYAGKHTDLGHVIGAAVREAVRAGVRESLLQWNLYLAQRCSSNIQNK